jgi:acetolactate synthase-1/3 small subunit
MLNTLVIYVENKPGVLSSVVSLFRRRNFNIDSLTVGRTEKPDVSRMTIVVEGDTDQVRRIVANVYKLVNVLLVDDITNKPSLLRDLALIKVTATQQTRSQILDIANVFKARVLDIALESITVEMTGGEEKVDRLLEILNPFGLHEVVRTGVVGMRRGATTVVPATQQSATPGAQRQHDPTVSYSV